MTIKDKDRRQLLGALNCKLKEKIKDIIFLELNKEIKMSSGYCIPKDIPLPMKSSDLIGGIKNGEYLDSISFEKFIECIIYTIGADNEFKFNEKYIEILCNTGSKTDSYILGKAFQMIDSKRYLDAIIYFNALDRISDKHMQSRYNIANTLRMLAVDSKNKDDSEAYELYYSLSYIEFSELSGEYPDNFYAHYYLGFYYMEEGEFHSALTEWQKAYSLADGEESRNEISKLIDGAKDNMAFEEGKEYILEGDVLKGFKILIPIIEKHDSWSEAKYYTALGYRKIGNFYKAELLLNELLASGEDFSEIYNELGLCCFNLDETQRSIENLKKAVDLKPYDQGYLCNLGIAYYKAGNIEKAKEVIEQAYQLKPDDEITGQCKRWIGGM